MKASEIIETLQELIKEHGDLDVVYSVDEEGNRYDEIFYPPSAGFFSENEFMPEDFFEDDEIINAICIN